MYSEHDRLNGGVAPFGYLRIKVCSQLPEAFRSVPRPSSPLSAKASTKCPSKRLSPTTRNSKAAHMPAKQAVTSANHRCGRFFFNSASFSSNNSTPGKTGPAVGAFGRLPRSNLRVSPFELPLATNPLHHVQDCCAGHSPHAHIGDSLPARQFGIFSPHSLFRFRRGSDFAVGSDVAVGHPMPDINDRLQPTTGCNSLQR